MLHTAETPPFTIEDESDGGDDIRMQYRYLDLRRSVVRRNLELRHKMAFEVRRYLDELNFLEVETPVLIKSTPEGARDFVVPSRMNPGEFYALPQSPQTLKQLLMVSGFDRYFQIVKCFRDEDLRADRQPEFTQIDCEMSFVEQEDVLNIFEGMIKHLFKKIRGIEFNEPFLRMTWADAMKYYGSDKPDMRFGMKFVEMKDLTEGHNFVVFDSAEYVGGICAEGCATYTRKQLDELTEFVKRPQIGAKGLVYVRFDENGTPKSSVDKFYSADDLKKWGERFGAKPGDLLLILAGPAMKTRKALCELRLEMGSRCGIKIRLHPCGLSIFPCSNGTRRPSASMPCITRLLPRKRKIFLYWIAIPEPSERTLTTWLSTVSNWVAGLSVYTTVNCKTICSVCWDLPKSKHWISLVS